ncbi:hypothetical protein ONZ43_g5056 [Nemania bipapillata]|uniref:Uncharacterized protein n=1 Tax=Nemania bipapillata TaxID=110536 RepID=A0ACC2IFA0_9PEZI|nr:hypothetical protein ONZ43_g5056 [Nemania bipapillata]
MNDPSYAVARELLPHVHLLSTYRHSYKAQVQPGEVTSLLMQAPKIARDTSAFFWTYIDRPENGQIFLTWQPLQLMGTHFSSDGFIWPPQEAYFTQEVGNGVILEMYYHKAGFAPGEHLATHSRRRFRLIPPNAPNPNAPQVDPSLWVVHYGPIENNERIPSQAIPRDPRIQSILDTRGHLQRCGQIQRKEFMLSDRVNWPQIAWPKEAWPKEAWPKEAPRQQMYAAGRGVPQNMAYPPHTPSTGTPSAKRARTNQSAHGQLNLMGLPVQTELEEEEDTSRGDVFDLLTPRDVSISRYKQNHEWMEEILSSAYRMGQIGFAHLGLGLKGELASLTEGIFEAQGANAVTQVVTKSAATRLDPDQAAEFRKRANDRIDSTKAEIERMKAAHARQMAKFKQNSLISTSEKELRTAVDDSSTEYLHLDGKEEADDGLGRWPPKHHKKVEDIVSQVEAHLNRRAEVIHDLRRIQQGGYQEPTPEPTIQNNIHASMSGGPVLSGNGGNSMSRQPSHAGSQQSGFMMGDSDIDMGGTAAGLLDQMHTSASSSSTPQPPMSTAPSNAATPANMSVPSPHPLSQQHGFSTNQGADVKMDGMDTAPGTAPDHGLGSSDWVVVPKGGATPDGNTDAGSTTGPPRAMGPSSKQPSAVGTPSVGFNGDNNDFSSLEDLNSAGEALAGFNGTPDGMSEGLDLNMEDSAFGDAFHGVDTQGGGGTPADSNM